MPQRIAFFDFDGTITTKDTLLEFVKHCKGKTRFMLGFLLTSPWMVAFKLKLISNQKGKEIFLRYFFRNTPLDRFEEQCRSFAKEKIPQLIRPKALQEISRLKSAGFSIVIVSASPEDWIRPWAETLDLPLLATRLVKKEQRITGKILDRNCHGDEKVRRIRETFNPEEYDDIYAYGDSSGDTAMLALATHPFYKPFR